MGIGAFAAGTTKAGADAPSTTRAPTVLDNPAAYDPTNRIIPLDASNLADDGSAPVKTAHWVDTTVAICLSCFLGDLPSDPTIGLSRARLAAATEANAYRVISSVVRDALARLIARSVIDIDSPGLGVVLPRLWLPERRQFAVNYQNLLLPHASPQTVNVGKGLLY